ncbi:MAG: serine/threonine protein kinase, partial [Acidobacteriota bacterium]|nr:serine/threonine protein kinase [Acidobacteriota bacterium]
MKAERWQEVERLYHAALECEEEARAAYLAEACAGDEALRREVESLLKYEEKAEGFIEVPALEVAAEVLAKEQMGLVIGQTVGHYKIMTLVGAGGMGEVYLAEDTKLGRKVALKALPTDVARNHELIQRFIQEARTASALSHANIAHIYELGEADGLSFIAMEYVDGETLRQHLERRRLKIIEALDVAIQVAGALAAAHRAGIIHRDIKPENIMLRADGSVKVLDFGLAKLLERQQIDTETATLVKTSPGMIMGTPRYMSPEQARGQEVDARSDIWSLGVVLYEMVAGRAPFEGATTGDVIAAILEKKPFPLLQFSREAPIELGWIINRALDKDREMRCQTAADLRADLARLKREIDAGHVSASNLANVGPTVNQPSFRDHITEPVLTDSDPRVQSATRFSKASVALAVIGTLTMVVAWLGSTRFSFDAELKLKIPKVAAISKARETVADFGYDTTGLREHASFVSTGFNLNHVASSYGPGQARQAIRDHKVAIWKVAFSNNPISIVYLRTAKPGEFLVSIDSGGHVVGFSTAPSEEAAGAGLEREEAIPIAESAVRRSFSIDPSGYDVEYVRRPSLPRVVEIAWRNPNPVFDHRETVHVNLQGPRVTGVSRSLEPPPGSGNLERDARSLLDSIRNLRKTINTLAGIAAFAFGLIFLIKGKRWEALGRRLPLAATLMLAVSLFVGAFMAPVVTLESRLSIILFAVIFGVAFFPSFAGSFAWLNIISPLRLYGAERFVEGHLFSRGAAASLVHGVLGGALMIGLAKSSE